MTKSATPLRIQEQGFSLVEVLFGVMIFMFGMLGVVALLTASVRDNLFSGNLSEATVLASSKLEVLMGSAYTSANLTDTDGDGAAGIDDVGCGPTDTCTAKADGMDANQGKNGIYTVYWNIVVGVPMQHCKQIKVFVLWNSRESSRQISMSGYRTEDI